MLGNIQHVCNFQATVTCPTPPQTLQLRSIQHVCNFQATISRPTPTLPKHEKKQKIVLRATAVQQSVSNYLPLFSFLQLNSCCCELAAAACSGHIPTLQVLDVCGAHRPLVSCLRLASGFEAPPLAQPECVSGLCKLSSSCKMNAKSEEMRKKKQKKQGRCSAGVRLAWAPKQGLRFFWWFFVFLRISVCFPVGEVFL